MLAPSPNVRLVMVWGPPRSGTTWLFNVVTHVLDAAGIPTVHSHADVPLPAMDPACAAVIKSHQPIDAALLNGLRTVAIVRCFAMLRDPHSAFQSLLRTQSASRAELLTWLAADIDALHAISADLPPLRIIREEWIAEGGIEIVARVVEELQIDLPPAVIKEIAARLERDQVATMISEWVSERGWRGTFDEFDEDTHWHANHIAHETFSRETLTAHEHVELARLTGIVTQLSTELSILSAPAVRASSTHGAPMLSPLEVFELAREGLRAREGDQHKPGVMARVTDVLRRGRRKIGVTSS